MQRFSHLVISWWFSLLVPPHTTMATVSEREYERKRRLLSFLLLLDLVVSLICLVLEICSLFDMSLVFAWSAILIFVFAFWMNRQGYLHEAALISLLGAGALIFFAVQTLSLVYPTALLWGLPVLVFYLAVAGLLLPAWTICLLAVLEQAVFWWYLCIVCYQQLIHLIPPQEFQTFFLYVSLWIYFCAFIGATYAVTTRRAVKQADRAAEVEQAHQTIAQAYRRLEVAHATIQQQALTDSLTGLPNHRAVMDHFLQEMDRARCSGHSLSVLFFDADRFKRVNDTYGHTIGDAVLRQIGERAGLALHERGLLGRFGGEEFVVLLPNTGAHEARGIAEHIRATIAADPVATRELEGGIAATVSMGLAVYPYDGDTAQALLSQADEAMYLAKRLGRNQIRTVEEMRRMQTDTEEMTPSQEAPECTDAHREATTLQRLRA